MEAIPLILRKAVAFVSTCAGKFLAEGAPTADMWNHESQHLKQIPTLNPKPETLNPKPYPREPSCHRMHEGYCDRRIRERTKTRPWNI